MTKPHEKSKRPNANGGPARKAFGNGAKNEAMGVATPSGGGAMAAIDRTVTGLGYDLVEIERLPRGLMRVSIDRIPGKSYTTGVSDFVTVEDCELVTRQLQYVLEVEQVDYARLEVSSPGLDRPLRKPADWQRFCGEVIDLTLKLPFDGRKKYQGVLAATNTGWRVVFLDGKTEKALDFNLDEVREARLVAQVDFKGRRQHGDVNQAGAMCIQGTNASSHLEGHIAMTPTGEQKQ